MLCVKQISTQTWVLHILIWLIYTSIIIQNNFLIITNEVKSNVTQSCFRILKCRTIFIRFIRPQQWSRDKMYSTQCSLELGTQRYMDLCASNNGKPRIDLWEFKQTEKSKFPTKKGISLNFDQFKIFALATDMVDTAMNKNEDLHYHIGGNIFLTLRSVTKY